MHLLPLSWDIKVLGLQVWVSNFGPCPPLSFQFFWSLLRPTQQMNSREMSAGVSPFFLQWRMLMYSKAPGTRHSAAHQHSKNAVIGPDHCTLECTVNTFVTAFSTIQTGLYCRSQPHSVPQNSVFGSRSGDSTQKTTSFNLTLQVDRSGPNLGAKC